MNGGFDLKALAPIYDSGRLVPFIGSGMSMPVGVDWITFVERLESRVGIQSQVGGANDLIGRALVALQIMNRDGIAIPEAISNAVYAKGDSAIPKQAVALAAIFWPLVCTTNYDDVYLRALLENSRRMPQLLGRSENDCQELLRHLNFPTGQTIWSLQGMLAPRNKAVKAAFGKEFPREKFERELVIGHAQYREVTHRAPHFRRTFAEVFRSRSFLFLGSGLAEPYFRSLFDEILELTGPPSNPHFAIMEEGSVSSDFMRNQYHILCHFYPKGQHERLTDRLIELARFLDRDRTRPSAWGFRLSTPQRVSHAHACDDFKIIRAGPPKVDELAGDEVVAVSCGREYQGGKTSEERRRGYPRLSDAGEKLAGIVNEAPEWIDDWTVRWASKKQVYGIVARELLEEGASSRECRSPEAIRRAFHAFLGQMHVRSIRIAHVQLLAAGKSKVFHPWVSVVQMARAYGQWFRETYRSRSNAILQVHLYVVDPSAIAMLKGGYIDLVEHLEETPFRISVETIYGTGQRERHYFFVESEVILKEIVGSHEHGKLPKISVHPVPTLSIQARSLREVEERSLRELGVVPGGTLFVDYR